MQQSFAPECWESRQGLEDSTELSTEVLTNEADFKMRMFGAQATTHFVVAFALVPSSRTALDYDIRVGELT